MSKEIFIVILCLHFVLTENKARVERSDKVGSAKMALASGLAKLGQVATNQLAGNYCSMTLICYYVVTLFFSQFR